MKFADNFSWKFAKNTI